MSESEIFLAYQTLFQQLKNFADEGNNKKNELQIANSVALENTFKLLPAYRNVVTNKFNSKIFSENFATNSHKATENINRWVADKTNGKIEKLLENDLDSMTMIVLLNAIYFKGTWKYKFDKKKTITSKFTYNVNQEEDVQMMCQRSNLRYAHFDDGDLVELIYSDETDSDTDDNHRLSMLIYLPDRRWVKEYQTISGQFARILEHGSIKLAARLQALHNASVNLHLPRFRIESKFKLSKQLKELGIQHAFSQGGADFRRIDGGNDLYLHEVYHQTMVEVMEDGTEAAAATASEIQTKSLPVVHQFFVNRPFLFLIRDNYNQLTLFAGVVNKP